MNENYREMLWMAGAFVVAYWAVAFTTFLWSLVCLVAKALIANAILP